MANKDYAETLFDAVGILLDKKIESVKFDQTIKAVVVDSSDADLGKYTVSTGSAKFVAYSTEPGYKVNDPVLVTIPQGNYDNQKIIIGKQVDDTTTPMVYKSPFQTIVDLSNNIIIDQNYTAGYWANAIDPQHHEEKYYAWPLEDIEFQDSDCYKNNQYMWYSGPVLLQGYTRIGLQAQFSTWLNEYNTIVGNYGLVLEVMFKCLDVPEEPNTFSKFIILDSSSFFGNVYNFETFYTQEDVFNIAEYIDYPIIGFKLFPYQRCNFKNNMGEMIYEASDVISDDFGTINPNIFIQNPYLCLGIDVGEFTTDTATLMTDNTMSYYKGDISDYVVDNTGVNTLAVNTFINARMTEDDNDFKTLFSSSAYRDLFLNSSNEGHISVGLMHQKEADFNAFAETHKNNSTYAAPEFWPYFLTLLRQAHNLKDVGLRWVHKDAQSDVIKTMQPNEFLEQYQVRWYRYKLGAQSPDLFAGAHWERFYGNMTAPNEDGDWAASAENDITTDQLEISFQPNVNLQEEKLKAIVLKKEGEIFRLVAASNIITFTNNNEVRSQATIIDMNALSIRYDDEERGHYFLYNRAGKIGKQKDGEIRTLTAVFDPNEDNVYNKTILTNYTSIKWIFPQGNSMITPATSAGLDAVPANVYQFENVVSVGYFINKTLNRNATNNVVRLEVAKDGQTYTAEVNMLFGTAGTSGSDYTLVLQWEGGKNALNISPGFDNSITGQVYLMDSSGQAIDIPARSVLQAEWYAAASDSSSNLSSKTKEDKDIFYPVLSGNVITGLPNVAHDYYFPYDSSDITSEYYSYDLNQKKFVQEQNISSFQNLLYRKRKNDGEKKNKLEFVAYNDLIPSNWVRAKYFVKYNDVFIIDPWDEYQEVETYYYPVEAEDYEYSYDSDGYAYIDDNNIQNRKITISKTSNTTPGTLLILQLTLSNFGDYDLVAYYPIPIKNGEIKENGQDKFLVDYIEGPTDVRYATTGELDFEKNPYQIFFKQFNNNEIEQINGTDFPTGYWRLLYYLKDSGETKLDADAAANFLPSLIEFREYEQDNQLITQQYSSYYKKYTSETPALNLSDEQYQFKNNPQLNPTGVYFKNAPLYGVQYVVPGENNSETVYWTQPILVYQDNYPSTTLNKWNGKDITTDDDTGTIVANGMAAGKKERDNTFTGVVLGDWSRTDTDSFISAQTGVYGFNHGAMSYALKDDGTAFFGKDGKGRIYLNGNKSQIYSSNWLRNSSDRNGMLIDIDDGKIQMISNQTGSNNTTRASSIISSTNPYFQIKDINDHTLIHIGDSSYYLQSSDFSTSEQTGLQFDLKDGKLTGYDFEIRASKGFISENTNSYSYNTSTRQIVRTTTSQSYSKTFILSSNDNDYPLKIGSRFKVSWTGRLTADGGSFTDITASGGSFSTIEVSNLYASSGNFAGYISAAGGSFRGGVDAGDYLSAGSIYITDYGYIGRVQGVNGSVLGLSSSGNIAVRGSYFSIQSDANVTGHLSVGSLGVNGMSLDEYIMNVVNNMS